MSPAFRFMAEWWKQLYGESEGKDGKGLFPASVEFTADLHSMGQYIQEGSALMFETVVRLDELQAPGRHPPTTRTNVDGLNFLAGQHHGLHQRAGHARAPCWPTSTAACPTSSSTAAGISAEDALGAADLLLRVCLRPVRLPAGRQPL